jgi:CubicO group peptidase (beta-lactamase class C family)
MKNAILAAAAALALTSPSHAQTAQHQLDERYNRALAAGYKALFLCSAIANAEANGTTRTPESVHEWELTGIQAPLNRIVRDLPYEIIRRPTGQIAHVQVRWDEDMPDRLAVFDGKDAGCSVPPVGAPPGLSNPTAPKPWEREEREDARIPLGLPPGPPPSLPSLDAAFSDKYGNGRTTAVVVRVFENGRVKANYARSAPGFSRYTPQRTWSVAKSIAATLVGAAVHRDEIDVNDSAGLGVDESDPRRAITIDHALRMASGRYSDTPGNRTDPLYWGGTSVEERAQDWPLIYTPGSVYRYANNDTLAAIKAIEDTFANHPPADFFAEIGMTRTVAERDWRGDYVLSSQVWSTAWDLAAIGQLYLNDGMLWNGTRILPEGWVEYVSSPSGPQPEGRPFGYGAGWWLMNSSEGVPSDTFAAFGNRGQYVVVVPSRDVVIVRRGEDMVGTRFDIAAFTRDVLAALE